MSQITSIIPSLLLFIAHLFISDVVSRTFTITNKCNFTVWPAIATYSSPSTVSPAGFSLGNNESKIIAVPSSWRGRFWGRTYCSGDLSGNFSCITGDCGSGKLECSSNGAPPATLVEFSLDQVSGLDVFDVSLVDGYNLPLLVVPSAQNCRGSGCVTDLNEECPSELKVTSSDGKTVGCHNACYVTRLSMYCQNGKSLYAQLFKNACPQAFSYPTDDNTNTNYTCASAEYQITFCPVFQEQQQTLQKSDNTSNSSRKTAYLWQSANMTVIAGNPSPGTSPGDIVQSSNMAVTAGNLSPGTSPGDTVPNPSPGDTVPNPSPGDIVPNPSPGDTVPNPSPGDTVPNPSPGDTVPNPSPGDTVPNPSPGTSPGNIVPSLPPGTGPNITKGRNWAPIVEGLAGGLLVIISVVVVVIIRITCKNTDEDGEEDDHIKQVPGMPVRFLYEDLRIATHDFKVRLGRGGFGSVFKGVLSDGTEIAVKRLDKLGQGKSAFLAEVETIGSVHHFNLVRLIGFCAEKSYRLLVYEYMSNKSLDNWIFKQNQASSLDWKQRKKIILDIAKGLTYLHEECRQTIIHLDIKPQNILLDQDFNAKISDFGLSKLMDREMSQVQLSMRGTPGYLAPEWCRQLGHVTVKVDVYSFGIVLLEVVCARRCVDHSQSESAVHLLRMLQKEAEYVVDNLDGFMLSDREEILKMIKIGAWCLQDDPQRRPLMSTVVKVLEGVMEVDSDLLYKFAHALTPSPIVNHGPSISSAPPPASVLSNPR